jgi:hypothetical protein
MDLSALLVSMLAFPKRPHLSKRPLTCYLSYSHKCILIFICSPRLSLACLKARIPLPVYTNICASHEINHLSFSFAILLHTCHYLMALLRVRRIVGFAELMRIIMQTSGIS